MCSLAGAPVLSRVENPSIDVHLVQHGPAEDLAAAGPDSASLEAAHRAIDHLFDQHRQATEVANRTQQHLED